jgi:hypothetical protein
VENQSQEIAENPDPIPGEESQDPIEVKSTHESPTKSIGNNDMKIVSTPE